jgi:hypothetical protein
MGWGKRAVIQTELAVKTEVHDPVKVVREKSIQLLVIVVHLMKQMFE